MKLKSLRLKTFRSYSQKVWLFDHDTTLIVGDNGVGKTNLMEAVWLLSTGKSFRASKDSQMIFYGQELARVSGEVTEGKNLNTLEVVLTKGEVAGTPAPKKRHLINGVPKRQMDFVGSLRCVLFRPEDIELVLGSPSRRRDYLNSVLEQVDREYRRSLLSYQKGLRQRNKLLEKIRESEAERSQLLFWDRLLIKNGEIIRKLRAEFLARINQVLAKKDLELKLEYDASVISQNRLSQYAENEVASATTLVGPHRDDFMFIRERSGKAKKNLEIFGSRGEQRMAVVAVKLGELEFVKEKSDSLPILLLDDVFSELDHLNRRQIFKLIGRQQTIITTADEHLIPKRVLSSSVGIIHL